MPGVDEKQSEGLEVHRLKARLVFQDGQVKMIQGVREVFEIFDAPSQSAPENGVGTPLLGKVVVIGRQLQTTDLERSFLDALK